MLFVSIYQVPVHTYFSFNGGNCQPNVCIFNNFWIGKNVLNIGRFSLKKTLFTQKHFFFKIRKHIFVQNKYQTIQMGQNLKTEKEKHEIKVNFLCCILL